MGCVLHEYTVINFRHLPFSAKSAKPLSHPVVASEGLHSGARARIITLVTGVRYGRCLATLAPGPAGAAKAGVTAAREGVKQA